MILIQSKTYLRKIIRGIISEILETRNINEYQRRKNNDLRIENDLHSIINEGDQIQREDVIDKLKNNDFEKPDAERFKEALSGSKHSEMLSDYSVSEFRQMKLFKLNGYNIGFALKKFEDGSYSEIVSVFNNEPDIKNIGKELMASAIRNGGCYLDHFDGFLSWLYQSMGFEEYKRDEFNPQYDEDGKFREKYGEADVIYRKHKNCK